MAAVEVRGMFGTGLPGVQGGSDFRRRPSWPKGASGGLRGVFPGHCPNGKGAAGAHQITVWSNSTADESQHSGLY
jgi:hypothetical protein